MPSYNPNIFRVPTFAEMDEYLDPLSLLLGTSDLSMHKKPERGSQWNGQHFAVFLRYALKFNLSISSNTSKQANFTGLLLGHLEQLAKDCLRSDRVTCYTRFLKVIDSLMPKLRVWFFAVVKAQQDDLSNEIIASFVHCLVEAIDKLLFGDRDPNIFVPDKIDALWEKLKFLLAILGDKPFYCTQLEEAKNVLGEIQAIANEAGIFLLSFFITMDCVTCAEMDRELSVLLPKFEMVEAKIKEHCVTFSSLPTQNTTASFSMFIIDSVLDDLNQLIDQKTDFVADVKDQITALHKELNYARSFLPEDQTELQQNKESIAIVRQFIDLAYEVEYIVRCFMAETVPVWYVALRIPDFILKSKIINASLPKFELYSGIRSIEVSESSREEVLTLTQVAIRDPIIDEIIIGFEEKTTEILAQLVRGPRQLQIVSIFGMGGIGKTTLTNKLYNHSSVDDRFDRRSWCVVSQAYRKRKLLFDILRSLIKISDEEASNMEETALGERVYKNLKGNRYPIVIDDIWDKKAWEDVKRYFPDDANGSRILFTTRNKDVADGTINKLDLLSDDECCDLLERKLLKKGIWPLGLEDIGRKIATKCKGLPLAVVGIAGVLANIPMKKSSWKEVASALSSFISKDQDVLELSYLHLPTRLKPCFLYLGIFEEDMQIPIRKVLWGWVSHGFIPKKKGESIEDVAEKFMMELIDRNLVQVATRTDNQVERFKIHDLIRDMCFRIGTAENFVKVIKDESSICEQHHYLSINSSLDRFRSVPFGLHVQSLLTETWPHCHITSGFKLLRVLQIITISGAELKFLVHLRYLEVLFLTPPLQLSHANLEYLIVKGNWVIEPPELLLNMPKLRFVYFTFPTRLSSSLDISPFRSLENLFGLLICDSSYLELLTKFSGLRRLKCTLSNEFQGVFIDFSSLTLLESLKIKFFGYRDPVTRFPNNIKEITLSGYEPLSSEILSSVGKLPELEILKLYEYCSFSRPRKWNTNNDEFQKLKYLKLRRISFNEWNFSTDSFPQLERLVLKYTKYPEVLPSKLGYIPTLRFLELYHCGINVRNSAMKIYKEQAEDGNEVLKVGIQGEYLGII